MRKEEELLTEVDQIAVRSVGTVMVLITRSFEISAKVGDLRNLAEVLEGQAQVLREIST
jgi:hypothetical protein